MLNPSTMAAASSKDDVAKIFQTFAATPSPGKKQATLDFRSLSPEEKQQKAEKEAQANQEAKAEQKKLEDMQKALAEEWGIPWPKPVKIDMSKGGPKPRASKWENGLYEWIKKINIGELQKPEKPPPREFPADWKHKSCPVWCYQPTVAPQGTPAAGASSPPEPPEQSERQTGSPHEVPKRNYHLYPVEVVNFYFQFEMTMGGPR